MHIGAPGKAHAVAERSIQSSHQREHGGRF
jgi:hypothetical protein